MCQILSICQSTQHIWNVCGGYLLLPASNVVCVHLGGRDKTWQTFHLSNLIKKTSHTRAHTLIFCWMCLRASAVPMSPSSWILTTSSFILTSILILGSVLIILWTSLVVITITSDNTGHKKIIKIWYITRKLQIWHIIALNTAMISEVFCDCNCKFKNLLLIVSLNKTIKNNWGYRDLSDGIL